jgi:hypothetical protein
MEVSKIICLLLCEIIEKQDFQEIKTSLEIRVNRQDTQTFVMQSSRSEIYNRDYFISTGFNSKCN